MHQQAMLPSSPIARALAVVGDRWTVLVLREMFLGKTRFSELVQSTGASRATLSKRLRALLDNGLLYQKPYQQKPLRVEYRLTDKGAALYDFALSIWQWEHRYGEHDEQRLPPRLKHRVCGKRFLPQPLCGYCHKPISIQAVRVRPGTSGGQSTLNQGTLRRSSAALAERDDGKGTMLHFIDLVADHWTPLVLAAAFMGMHRYDDIRRELGIATNILSQRLKLLVEAGALRQQPGSETSRRQQYRLTDKGRALIIPALALHQWSLKWLPSTHGASMQIHHDCSKKPLRMRMQCNRCDAPLLAKEVAF